MNSIDGGRRLTNRAGNDVVLPVVAFALLVSLLFIKLPAPYRSPGHASSESNVSSAIISLPDAPLSGAIYAPSSANRLIAQTGTHMRVDGWLGIRDQRIVVRNIIILLDGRPLGTAYILQTQVVSPSKAIRCEWGAELSFVGVEPGDHRLEAVVVLGDGSPIPIDEKSVLTLD